MPSWCAWTIHWVYHARQWDKTYYWEPFTINFALAFTFQHNSTVSYSNVNFFVRIFFVCLCSNVFHLPLKLIVIIPWALVPYQAQPDARSPDAAWVLSWDLVTWEWEWREKVSGLNQTTCTRQIFIQILLRKYCTRGTVI